MELFSIFARIGVNKTDFDKGLSEAEAHAKGFGKTIDSSINQGTDGAIKALTKFSKWGGAALLAVGGFATKVGMDFEKEMSNVAALTGYNADEMKRLESAVRSVSKESGASMMDLARSVQDLVEQGGDLNLVLQQMEHGTNLAIGTNTDLRTTFDFTSAAMKTFGYEADVSQQVMDSLAFATTKTNMSLDNVASAYVNAAGAAANAGLSMDDMNAILVAMSEAGLKGSAAGTSLRAVLANLSTPTGAAADALEELEISLYDANGASRDMFEIMQDLETALAGKTDAQKSHYENVIFDTVAQKGWNMIANEGIVNIMALSTELSGASDNYAGLGQAAGMAAIQQDNLAGSVTRFKNELTDAGISIFQKFQEPIKKAVDGATQALSWLISNLDGVIKVVGVATAGIIGMTVALSIGAKIQAANIAFKNMAVAVKTTALAQDMFTAALSKNSLTLAVQTAAKKAKMTIDTAGNLITAAGTKATAAETLAVLGSSGALSAKAIIAALVTKQIGFVTAAQWLWNAAMMANPIGIIVAGIIALIAVIVALIMWFNRETAEAKAVREETERLVAAREKNAESAERVAGAVRDSANAHQQNSTAMEAEIQVSKNLLARIEELNKIENKSAEQKAQLATYVQALNDNMGETVAVINQQTGELETNIESIHRRISALADEARMEAMRERMVEVAREQLIVEEERERQVIANREAWEKYNEIQKRIEEGDYANRAEKKALEEQMEEVRLTINSTYAAWEELDGQHDVLGESFENLGERIADSMLEAEEAICSFADESERSAERARIVVEELAAAQIKALEMMASEYDTLAGAATDMFAQISTKSKLSIDDMQKNLEHNQKVVADWSENIAALSAMGIDDGLLETLRSAGPSSAAYVQAIVDGGSEKIMELSDTFANGGDVAVQALANSLGVDTDVAQAARGLAESSANALQTAIDAAQFDFAGGNVSLSFAMGIDEKTYEAELAAQGLGDDTIQALKKIIGMASPAKEFVTVGEASSEGYGKGITDKVDVVLTAIQNLATSVLDTCKTAMDKALFVVFGNNVGEGMAEGIKASEAAAVAAAKNMAAAVTAAAKVELDIGSPSKKFNNFGRMTGQGLKEGIEKSEGAAVAAAKKMASAVAEAAKAKLEISSPSGLFKYFGRMTGEGYADGVESTFAMVKETVSELLSADYESNDFSGREPQLAMAGAGGNNYYLTIEGSRHSPYEQMSAAQAVFERARWLK